MLNTLSKHWIAISEAIVLVLTAFGLLLARQQVDLATKQLNADELKQPRLTYSSRLAFSSIDGDVLTTAREKLIERFFEQTNQYKQSQPSITYLEAANAVLPMTATLPARTYRVQMQISNNGQTTLTKVHAILNISLPIESFDVSSIEPFRVLKGGAGQKELSIEVDRIVAGRAVTVTLAVAPYPENSKQLDQFVLDSVGASRKAGFDTNPSFSATDFFSKKSTAFNISSIFSPLITFIPAQQPSLDLIVTSDQVEGHELPTPTPTR